VAGFSFLADRFSDFAEVRALIRLVRDAEKGARKVESYQADYA